MATIARVVAATTPLDSADQAHEGENRRAATGGDGTMVDVNMYPVPSAQPSGQRDPKGAPWPGLIPLRPLGIGEIFAASARLVRTHTVVLCTISLIGGLLSGGAVLAILASLSDRSGYFTGAWMSQVQSTGRLTMPPASVIWPLLIGDAISFVTTIVVSGLAAALAADGSLGRPTSARAAVGRLRGRWLILAAVSVLVALCVFVGVLAFILPGLILLAALMFATPVAVIEKAAPLRALARSARLSTGLRLRIFGVMALAYLITGLISTILLTAAPPSTDLSSEVLPQLLLALISAFTIPWTAGVVALLYIDTRIRKENLAATLIRASLR